MSLFVWTEPPDHRRECGLSVELHGPPDAGGRQPSVGRIFNAGLGPGRVLRLHGSGASVEKGSRGNGLGQALYLAAFVHAHAVHGDTLVRGGGHTVDADRVHTAIARKYGTTYDARPLGENCFDVYEYAVTSRMVSRIVAVARGLDAGEPGQRAGAGREERLRSRGCER